MRPHNLELIIFISFATLSLVYRLALGRHPHDPAWFVLPFAVAAPVLALFYPRRVRD